MAVLNSDEFVERIVALMESGDENETSLIEKIHSGYEISKEEAELILELVRTGLFRAQIIATNKMYPKNNLENNEIVNSALKIGLSKLGRPELYSIAKKETKPWWKLW